jgi:hypothetical protein
MTERPRRIYQEQSISIRGVKDFFHPWIHLSDSIESLFSTPEARGEEVQPVRLHFRHPGHCQPAFQTGPQQGKEPK